MLIIDENTPTTTADDSLVRSIPLERPFEVRMDTRPSLVGVVNQPTPPNYNDATFAADTTGHKAGGSTVTNHSVWAARFRSDGSVVNSFGNPISTNLYLWPPRTPGNAAARHSRGQSDHNVWRERGGQILEIQRYSIRAVSVITLRRKYEG